jgi:tryptophan synthase alpha chain
VSIQRLHRAFEHRPALITYVMGGDGGTAKSVDEIVACAQAGANVVEIGFPFSDPIADGRVIQAAAGRALATGTTLHTVFDIAKQARARTNAALVLMGYLNPVLTMGIEPFMTACEEAGIDGVIIPDLPPEEAGPFCAAAQKHDIGTIFLLAPTSTPAREQAVIAASTGFVYFVSVTGVTGTRAEAPDIREPVERVKVQCKVPVAVGFGISTPEQARQVGTYCDGVVVGSALVERIARGESPSPFVTALRAALSSKESKPC